jgi:hypothetical protein
VRSSERGDARIARYYGQSLFLSIDRQRTHSARDPRRTTRACWISPIAKSCLDIPLNQFSSRFVRSCASSTVVASIPVDGAFPLKQHAFNSNCEYAQAIKDHKHSAVPLRIVAGKRNE